MHSLSVYREQKNRKEKISKTKAKYCKYKTFDKKKKQPTNQTKKSTLQHSAKNVIFTFIAEISVVMCVIALGITADTHV